MTVLRGDETRLPESWLAWLSRQAPLETRLRQAGFQAILRGRPATPTDLAAELELSDAEVHTRLMDMAVRGLVEVDDRGVLVGCWGLSTRPTAHRLELNGRSLYTWCAVDAIGIPAALEADARVESRCAACGGPIEIELLGGAPCAGAGEATRVWVADIVPGRAMAGDT